jgi:hypothetical protein
MSVRDPINRNMARMQERRFAARCQSQIFSIERADTLRELSRLSSISVPYTMPDDILARDSVRDVKEHAEERARDLIREQLKDFLRAEDILRDKLKRRMQESWMDLTGPLGSLRSWAANKLLLAEQQIR